MHCSVPLHCASEVQAWAWHVPFAVGPPQDFVPALQSLLA